MNKIENKEKNIKFEYYNQTLIGKQKKTLQDIDTGEVIEVEQITKRALGQKQFWKLYLIDFLQILGVLDSKQVDVLIYMLENTEQANNLFIGTYKSISEDTKVSIETVRKVMKKLSTKNFIKKVHNGVYQISPEILMKGSEHKKQLLLSYFYDEYET